MGIILKDKNDNIFFDNFFKSLSGDEKLSLECKAALQSFMLQPKKEFKTKLQSMKKLQAMTVSTDLPVMLGESFALTVDATDFDLGYEQAFAKVPAQKGKLFWSVVAGHTSLVIKKVPEGGKIEVNGKTGDKTYFYIDKYGGAIGWTWEAVEGREVFQMIQEAELFRNKFYENKANVFYALLQAAAATNAVTPYDGGTDGQLRCDIRTINSAIYELTFRLRNKGYGNMASKPVVIYASRALENRINAALRASTDAMATQQTGAEQITTRPISVVYTYNASISATTPVVCVPGVTMTMQDYMLPTTYTAPEDILSLNKAQSVWAAYGGGIGDTEQCQNFLLS